MLPSMAGRAGVAGRRCLGIAKDDRLKAGVSEVLVAFTGSNKPGSEKRTRFDLRVEGVLRCLWLSDTTRGLAGDERTLLRRFGLRRAMGMSVSDPSIDAILQSMLCESKLVPEEALRHVWDGKLLRARSRTEASILLAF